MRTIYHTTNTTSTTTTNTIITTTSTSATTGTDTTATTTTIDTIVTFASALLGNDNWWLAKNKVPLVDGLSAGDLISAKSFDYKEHSDFEWEDSGCQVDASKFQARVQMTHTRKDNIY